MMWNSGDSIISQFTYKEPAICEFFNHLHPSVQAKGVRRIIIESFSLPTFQRRTDTCNNS